MAFTLTITDLANGTGARINVTPGVGEDAIEYRLQRAEQGTASLGDYENVGPWEPDPLTGPSGEGTIDGTGYYQWRVIQDSDDSVLAGPIYQPATAEGDSIHERCLVMLQDKMLHMIEHGQLVGLESVLIRGGGDNTNTSYPAAILMLADGRAEEDLGGGSQHDLVGYPVAVVIADRVAWKKDLLRARLLSWRQQLWEAINGQRWDLRVPEVYQTLVRPAAILPPFDGVTEYRESWLTLVCCARVNSRA